MVQKMKEKIKSAITMLSCNNLLRAMFPFFADWYSGFVIGEKEKKAIVSTRVVSWYRALFFWRFAPKKYTGGAILSLLGFQLIRYYFYNCRYTLRYRRSDISTECGSEGIALREGFISPEGVAKIQEFINQNKAKTINHFTDFSELVIANTNGVVNNDSSFRDITEYLLNECRIKKIGEELSGLDIKICPFISILHYKSFSELTTQLDGQDIPHADVFYPSFKLFVYLNEVNENNGAFRYLIGSQKFSFSNAMNAYRDSINYYFKGGKRRLHPIDATLGLKKKNHYWKSANGKPGDAIFFNVQGIHRRGDFLKDQFRERLALLVDFRQVEVPFQRLAANV
jgi:hypothetical protein